MIGHRIQQQPEAHSSVSIKVIQCRFNEGPTDRNGEGLRPQSLHIGGRQVPMQQQIHQIPLFAHTLERRRCGANRLSGRRSTSFRLYQRRITLDQSLLADPQSFGYHANPFLSFDWMLALLQNPQHIVHAADTSFDRTGLRCAQTMLEGKIQEARSLFFQTSEGLRPFLPHISIRVLSSRQGDDFHSNPAVHKQIEPSQCGTDPGLIRIEQQDDLRGKPSQHLNMLRRQCGPQRRNRMGQSGLVKRDRIEVPFHHDYGLQPSDRFPRKIQRIERLPLLEQGSIRRIQILWSPLAENTPAKTNDPFTQIRDRKHHAGAKTIVGPRRMFARHRQSCGGQITL